MRTAPAVSHILLASVAYALASVQIPLQLAHEDPQLDWDTEPDVDATGHFIFNSVSSLMQRWPNTVVRPGEWRRVRARRSLSYQITPGSRDVR